MKKMYAALLLAGLSGLIFAGDLVIKSGQVFQNYVIMGAAPNGIRVFFNNGEGDREVVLPVNQFPDELQETVKKFARKTQDAKQAEQQQQKQEQAQKAQNAKKAKDTAERNKKSGEIVKKEQEKNKQIQEKLLKITPKKSPSLGKKK